MAFLPIHLNDINRIVEIAKYLPPPPLLATANNDNSTDRTRNANEKKRTTLRTKQKLIIAMSFSEIVVGQSATAKQRIYIFCLASVTDVSKTCN